MYVLNQGDGCGTKTFTTLHTRFHGHDANLTLPETVAQRENFGSCHKVLVQILKNQTAIMAYLGPDAMRELTEERATDGYAPSGDNCAVQ